MVLLNLKDQREIVQVIEYLVEIHKQNDTVGSVMKRFDLTLDEYRMCCNLAVPALALDNKNGSITVLRNMNKGMRDDIKALYEAMKDEDGPAAEGVRRLYETYCYRRKVATFGNLEENDEVI